MANISTADFMVWVGEKVRLYLEANPQETLDSLAARVGVSAPTVSRWRSGGGAIADEHRPRLFDALGIKSPEAVYARERQVTNPVFPSVRTRGPGRPRAATLAPSSAGDGAVVPGLATRPTGRCAPRRVYALLIGGSWPANRAWLAPIIQRQHQALAQFLGQPQERAPSERSTWSLGQEVPVVLVPQAPSRAVVLDLLSMLRPNARSDHLILVGISALFHWESEKLHFPLGGGRESLAVGEVIERLTGGEWGALVVLEGLWLEDGIGFPGPDNPLVERELLGYPRTGLALIAAALPATKAQAEHWPFFSELVQQGLRSGAADLNQDGTITAEELCDYVSREIQPGNDEALRQRAAGHPAHVVPLPRLLSEPLERNIVVAVRAQEPSVPD
jgi:hypothetical protein